MNAKFDNLPPNVSDTDRIAALEAECARLRRDALRYQQVRDATEGPFIADWFCYETDDLRQLTGVDADAEIDAAIAARSEK